MRVSVSAEAQEKATHDFYRKRQNRKPEEKQRIISIANAKQEDSRKATHDVRPLCNAKSKCQRKDSHDCFANAKSNAKAGCWESEAVQHYHVIAPALKGKTVDPDPWPCREITPHQLLLLPADSASKTRYLDPLKLLRREIDIELDLHAIGPTA